jgi:aldehyde dehydrogenase (NAD+)
MQQSGFYIDGAWRNPHAEDRHAIIDPTTGGTIAHIGWATAAEVDSAVQAAKRAFPAWSATSKDERIAALQRLAAVYERRMTEMGTVISRDMGAPMDLAVRAQAGSGLSHLKAFIAALEGMEFDQPFRAGKPEQRIVHEPVGIAALITPWNWPMNQICLKVGAALAAGCTMVLKPSEIAPLSAVLFAEFVHEAVIPAGVFNLVHGDGAGAGSALVVHKDVDVVSFTGSTRAGIAITKAAADSVKRVSLELGGKSPNVIFADSDLAKRVNEGVASCFMNTGQSCNAPTRMLVERSVYDQAVALAADAAKATKVDLAERRGHHIGPLVSEAQMAKVGRLIESGIAEGARLVAGGPGRPEGLTAGWFVRPTVFADVTPSMTIWHEEVFGPVLAITPFDTEEEAVQLANDTPYGLAAYLQTGSPERADRVSRRLRAGMVHINGAARAAGMPFGGFKQSGVGREGGVWGIEEFLEVKSVSRLP